jgi:corrinoid protein of di/trimethylamine methyltransferase
MSDKQGIFDELSSSVMNLDEKKAEETAMKVLAQGMDPVEAVEKGLAAGLKELGSKYEKGELFLSQMVYGASVFQIGLRVLEPKLKATQREVKCLGIVVLGTVQGDIHDIGKSIVGALLGAAGFEVIDLGKDVPVEVFVNKARELKADIVGASALLTTTIPTQREIIQALKKQGLKCKVMIGGAACTEAWAKEIGADACGVDAIDAVRKAKALLGVA